MTLRKSGFACLLAGREKPYFMKTCKIKSFELNLQKGLDGIPRQIYFMFEQGENTELPGKTPEDLIKKLNIHYAYKLSDWSEATKFVGIATAQRCGTWMHKYFFKFYADKLANIPTHMGPDLKNPLYSHILNRIFFVGHLPCFFNFNALFENISDNNSKLIANTNRPTFSTLLKGGRVKTFHMSDKAFALHEAHPGYFQNFYTALSVYKKLLSLKIDVLNGSSFVYYYIFRNPFSYFVSMYAMEKRGGGLKGTYRNNFFKYVTEVYLGQYIFQLKSWIEMAKKYPAQFKLIKFEGLLKNRRNYFKMLFKDFNIPIDNQAFEHALFYSSKDFLENFETETRRGINSSATKVAHITKEKEINSYTFSDTEKDFIKSAFEKNDIPFKIFGNYHS